MRKAFVVGKLTGRTAEIILLDALESPLSGPWLLHALVRPLPPTLPPPCLADLTTVH